MPPPQLLAGPNGERAQFSQKGREHATERRLKGWMRVVLRREDGPRKFFDWYARATVEVRRRVGEYPIATELTAQVQRLRFPADVVVHRSTPLER